MLLVGDLAVGADPARQPLGETRFTEAVTRNGSIPMLSEARHRRGAVGVQGGQHQVAGQRGLDADPAVSTSRISPTMMMSGSWRRNARSAIAKVSPISWMHLHLVDPLRSVFDRVFVVKCYVGRVELVSTEYSVVVFPEPVGPVTKIIPSAS